MAKGVWRGDDAGHSDQRKTALEQRVSNATSVNVGVTVNVGCSKTTTEATGVAVTTSEKEL
jgi:hypothetical protein